MSSNLDVPYEQQVLVSFRCPPQMVEAMREAASKQFSSISEIARQAVLKEMRERGLLTE
jgi:hypothetical protein